MRLTLLKMDAESVQFSGPDAALTITTDSWSSLQRPLAVNVLVTEADASLDELRELAPGEVRMTEVENTEPEPEHLSGDQVIQVLAEPVTDEPAAALLERIVGHALRTGGELVVTRRTEPAGEREVGGGAVVDGSWAVGYHFGQETEGSAMVAGAAYGLGPTLLTALQGAAADLGIE